jgi:hypothetical protein
VRFDAVGVRHSNFGGRDARASHPAITWSFKAGKMVPGDGID